MPKHAVKCTARKAGKTTVVNPLTKRCVIVNGRTYYALVKNGVISKAVGHKSPKTIKKISPKKIKSPKKYVKKASPKKIKSPKKYKSPKKSPMKSPKKVAARK